MIQKLLLRLLCAASFIAVVSIDADDCCCNCVKTLSSLFVQNSLFVSGNAEVGSLFVDRSFTSLGGGAVGGPLTVAGPVTSSSLITTGPITTGSCSLFCSPAGLVVTTPAGTTIVGAGATGSAYGYIYNLTAETVAVSAPVIFDSSGPLLGITHTPSSDAIGVVNAGTYAITFSVSGVEPNQFAIAINGTPNAATVYGSGAGTQQNTGQAILTLAAGDTITLVNYLSTAAVTLQTLAGGTATNINASIYILRIA